MKPVFVALCVALASSVQSESHQQLARDIYKELIEINTTDTPAGNASKAAEAMAARLLAAGFPQADVQVLGPDPRKRNLVARFAATGTRRPHPAPRAPRRRRSAARGLVDRSVRRSSRRTATSTAAAPADDKAMAANFVANLLRMKQEGFVPDRDLILALTADEEGGDLQRRASGCSPTTAR